MGNIARSLGKANSDPQANSIREASRGQVGIHAWYVKLKWQIRGRRCQNRWGAEQLRLIFHLPEFAIPNGEAECLAVAVDEDHLEGVVVADAQGTFGVANREPWFWT